ncbi:tetratricopeptide repeat protein [Candidatus Sumerlaeota bacterium]|nr:tetratricopeptide repeat protein [Candidatus Sumerlaeota bacterium]
MMPDFKSDKYPLFILIAVVFLAFGNSLFHQFTYDDHKGIEGNRSIESLRNLDLLFSKKYFNIFGERSYRPVVTASYFFDHFLWGKRPFGYHLTNVLLHAFASLTFYFFLSYFFRERMARLFAALLFSLHPAVCEPVNSISFREDILAGLFVLMTLLLFLSKRPASPLHLCLGVFTGLFALFSKESALPLFIICLLFFVLYKKESGSYLKRALPFLILQFFILIFYVIIRFKIMVPDEEWNTRLLGGSASAAMAHSGFLFSKTWFTFIFPFHLNADYAFWNIKGALTPYSIGGALFICGYLILLMFFYKKRHNRIFIGLIWILLFFIPSSNLIPLTNPFAERYLYLALPGFAILGGFLYESILLNIKAQNERRKNILSLGIPTIFLMLLAFLSINRNLVWSTDKTLWESTLEREPDSVRALNGVGLVMIQKWRLEKAAELFQHALALDPLDYEVRNNLAVAHIRDGKPDLAKSELEKALRIKPDYAAAHYNLGRLYLSEGEEGLEKARRHLMRALELGYPVPDTFKEKIK